MLPSSILSQDVGVLVEVVHSVARDLEPQGEAELLFQLGRGGLSPDTAQRLALAFVETDSAKPTPISFQVA
jgi:hypothetical protein